MVEIWKTLDVVVERRKMKEEETTKPIPLPLPLPLRLCGREGTIKVLRARFSERQSRGAARVSGTVVILSLGRSQWGAGSPVPPTSTVPPSGRLADATPANQPRDAQGIVL